MRHIPYEMDVDGRVYLFDVELVGDYLAPGEVNRTSITLQVGDCTNLVKAKLGDMACVESRRWFDEVLLGARCERLCVTGSWFDANRAKLFNVSKPAENTESGSSVAANDELLQRIGRLEADERSIVEAIVERIDRGRKEYGPWNLGKRSDYRQEALEEIFDALNYCAAALLVGGKPATALRPKDDNPPWAPYHIRAARQRPKAERKGGGIQEYDARWRAQNND